MILTLHLVEENILENQQNVSNILLSTIIMVNLISCRRINNWLEKSCVRMFDNNALLWLLYMALLVVQFRKIKMRQIFKVFHNKMLRCISPVPSALFHFSGAVFLFLFNSEFLVRFPLFYDPCHGDANEIISLSFSQHINSFNYFCTLSVLSNALFS